MGYLLANIEISHQKAYSFLHDRCEENSSTLSYLIDQHTVNQEKDDIMVVSS